MLPHATEKEEEEEDKEEKKEKKKEKKGKSKSWLHAVDKELMEISFCLLVLVFL